jgi:chemotaxis protein MotA
MLIIVGAVIVIGCVIGGFVIEGGHPLALVQPAEFIIIGGAALGSLVVATPLPIIKALVSQSIRLFKGPKGKEQYLELLAMLFQLFKLSQHGGIMALESHVEKPESSAIFSKFPGFLVHREAFDFLADSVKVMIVGGISPHDLDSLLELDLDVRHHHANRPASTLGKVADSLPGLGIVAAVLGVVNTMAAIDGPPSEIGEKVGAALVGTFLGILMCYGFVGPIAGRLEQQIGDEGNYEQAIKAGLVALYKGLPPLIAIEFARRVLPEEVRPTFEETESACRGAAKPEAAAA